jgi:hypothetical protein
MMKRIAFYPFLLVLYLVLYPIYHNLSLFGPQITLRALVLLLAITATGMFLLTLVFRDWRYAGYLVFLALMFFLAFGLFYRAFHQWQPSITDTARQVIMAGWGLLLILLGLKWMWRRFGGGDRVTLVLNTSLILMLVSQLITSLPDLAKAAGRPAQKANESTLPITGGPVELDCSNRPDIYYIVLDAHGRWDILNKLYGVDSTPFLNYLKNKGFYIAEKSHSNYIQTIFSVSSSLNFSFIEPAPDRSSWIEYYTDLIVHNRLMNLLKECGYQTVGFETGFSFTEMKNADTYLANEYVLNPYESLLVADTPVDVLFSQYNLDPLAYSYPAHRARILSAFEQLQKIPKSPGPKIVFAHIMSPHPPFVFTADGQFIQPSYSHTIADGDEFPGTLSYYHSGYAEQVQFVDKKLEQVIDAILKESSAPPIIIIQGDHGPGGSLSWDSPDKSCLMERTSILNAYYLPGGATQSLYPGITPVNTFRVILDAYFHAGLELLPEDTYYTTQRSPNKVIDITNWRDSSLNCPATAGP